MRKMAFFENVDIIETLRKIMQHNTEHYQSDFEYDIDMIREMANARYRNQGMLWMSRRSGTWALNDKDVFIRETPAYRTWRAYDGKKDGVRAFWVWPGFEHSGIIRGNIVELDYEKMKKDFSKLEFSAESVYLYFQQPEHSRSFSVSEFQNNFAEIVNRYGEVKETSYQLADETSLQAARNEVLCSLYQEAQKMDVDEYIACMDAERFGCYGYTDGSFTFTSPDDAADAIKRGLLVYGFTQDTNQPLLLRRPEQLEQVIYGKGIFGMAKEEKKILEYLQRGNSGLFTHEENQMLYQMMAEGKAAEDFPREVVETIEYKLVRIIYDQSIEKGEMKLEQQDTQIGLEDMEEEGYTVISSKDLQTEREDDMEQ